MSKDPYPPYPSPNSQSYNTASNFRPAPNDFRGTANNFLATGSDFNQSRSPLYPIGPTLTQTWVQTHP